MKWVLEKDKGERKMLKNKKAFTLVELLAVIIILGIILVLAVPRITTMINKFRTNAEARQKELIANAAEKYMVFETQDIVITYPHNITLAQLETAGYLKKDLTNPKTGKKLNNTATKVVVTKTGEALSFETILVED